VGPYGRQIINRNIIIHWHCEPWDHCRSELSPLMACDAIFSHCLNHWSRLFKRWCSVPIFSAVLLACLLTIGPYTGILIVQAWQNHSDSLSSKLLCFPQQILACFVTSAPCKSSFSIEFQFFVYVNSVRNDMSYACAISFLLLSFFLSSWLVQLFLSFWLSSFLYIFFSFC
jgi:hypothetical protein